MLWTALLAITLASLTWIRTTPDEPVAEVMYDDYRDIPASANLNWHPCFNDFLWAKLQVPMNHNAPAIPHNNIPPVYLALIMVRMLSQNRTVDRNSNKQTQLPGHNHLRTNDFSINPLLVNPGGPGASGVEFVRQLGHSLRNLTGEDRDIIGFDPRGVGFTKPTADCFSFSSDEETLLSEQDVLRERFNRAEFEIAGEGLGLVSEGRVKLRGIDDAYRAKAKLCGMKDGVQGEGSILRYLDTQSVARDFLRIVDAWDTWRDGLLVGKRQEVGDPANRTKGQLHYLGFSYGKLDMRNILDAC